MNNKVYQEIIGKAKSLGFADSISIKDMRKYYGEEIANKCYALFDTYMKKKNFDCYTLYSSSKITLTDKVDENGLPIINYKVEYKYYPKHAWVGFENYFGGQIINTIDSVIEFLQMYIDKYESTAKNPPFIQSEETKYENNEYENMPSLDFRCNFGNMYTHNKNKVDWKKVDEICAKYGLSYTIIYSTFGGDECEFVLYTKPKFSEEQYDKWTKEKAYDVFYEQRFCHKEIFQKMHDCVHELDENTRLGFKTGWAGNCGVMGSDDVRRQTYSFGEAFTDWKTIIDWWSPLIHDTERKLKKGVYIIMSTHYLK